MKRIALAGNPNSGKTTLFNSLTGATAHVGNWPGVTVDKREGVYKKCAEALQIVDLPGIYSLVSVHAGGGDFPKLHSGRKARLHNKHRRRDKSGKKPLSDHSAYGNRRADCGGAQHDGRREEKRRFGGRSYTRKENRFARGGNFRFERRGNFPALWKRLMLRARANAAE